MSTSRSYEWEDQTYLKRTQVFTNEYVSLSFIKIQDRLPGKPHKFSISGMLFRTYSEIDLLELYQVGVMLESRAKIAPIDP